MSRHDRNWFLWLAVTLGSFGWLEYRALSTRDKGGTLSETLQRWIGIYPRHRGRHVLSMVFLGFLAWLGSHIMRPPKET